MKHTLYIQLIEEIIFIHILVKGENSVKSVGGISGGGGSSSSGGGITSEQLTILTNLSTWWKLDDDGNLFQKKTYIQHRNFQRMVLGVAQEVGLVELLNYQNYPMFY